MKLLFLLLLLSVTAAGQSFSEWRGFILGQTTPETVLEQFKSPKSDKSSESFRPLKYDEWFVKTKDFRLIHFENIEGFSDVKLYFRDGKLVVIHLEPKKLKASLLEQTYNADFEVLVSGADKAMSPSSIETDRGKNYPKKFPTVYWLLHRSADSVFFAMVGNTGLKSMLGGGDDMNSFPGDVKQIQLISNALRSQAGSDLLK